jgi:hypothetical protein
MSDLAMRWEYPQYFMIPEFVHCFMLSAFYGWARDMAALGKGRSVAGGILTSYKNIKLARYSTIQSCFLVTCLLFRVK